MMTRLRGLFVPTEKPDMFGKYHRTMENIHNVLLEKIIYEQGFAQHKTKMTILQQSIFEYIEEKHDENYLYYIYDVIFPRLSQAKPLTSPRMIVCVNGSIDDRIDRNAIIETVRDTLQTQWSVKTKTTIIFMKTANHLDICTNDTIQTIHYTYESEQLFKIIYFYEGWKDVLGIS
jgi:hypothetical protein